jgi:hypothetical protein
MMTNFDWTHFRELTLAAARTAFVDIQRQHSDETFYAFALYTSGNYSYLLTTSNTEEGLTRAAEFYLANYSNSYKQLTLDEMRLSLRDSPCDWAYHCPYDYDALFEEICEMASSLQEVAQEADNDDVFQEVDQQFETMCLDILRQLDSEGVFGTGEGRRRVRLNLLMGDQSNGQRQYYASQLNPPEVTKQYQAELGATAKVQHKLYSDTTGSVQQGRDLLDDTRPDEA